MAITLHSFQAEAVNRLRAPEIHLALTAPTGSGKGVIIEALAQDPRERVLVLSPLIALARQQRLRLANIGIPNSRVRILSPESALARITEIAEWRPTLVAIDEAHCLSEWGERFRPAYGQVVALIHRLAVKRTLWLSATFPRTLVERIESEIPGNWARAGHFRFPPRLLAHLIKIAPTERLERIYETVINFGSPGILFAGTRKEVGNYLRMLGPIRPFLPYHAGLSDEERRSVESTLVEESRSDPAKTSIIATSAFGMGMDFPQFEWTLLARAPYSLLSLFQAFGRVARGTREGMAEIYWAEEDFRFAGLLLGTDETSDQTHSALALLRRYLEGTETERRAIEAEEFL